MRRFFQISLVGIVIYWVNNSSAKSFFPFSAQSFSGTVLAYVHPRSPLDQPVLRPLSELTIESASNNSIMTTDLQGRFYTSDLSTALTLNLGGRNFQAWLCGNYCYQQKIRLGRITHDQPTFILGNVESVSPNGNVVFKRVTEAERDALFHLGRIRTVVKNFIGSTWLSQTNIALVNSDEGVCNANFSEGTLHFYRAGTKGKYECYNTATIADIVYHEWTHGLIDSFQSKDKKVDSVAEEALADALTFHMTGDSRIGVGLFVNRPKSTNFLRDIAFRDSRGIPLYYRPGLVYGDDYVQSQILSGALWDLRTSLIRMYGHDQGNRISLRLLLLAMRETQSQLEFYKALLRADDNDGDLTNGTPHKRVIQKVFADHCLATDLKADYCSK